jgi:hypothetical protein
MMEAANTFETSVTFYQTTRCNIPEDSHLHTRRRENLKSHSDPITLSSILMLSSHLRLGTPRGRFRSYFLIASCYLLFIYLFNGSVNGSNYIALTDKMISD